MALTLIHEVFEASNAQASPVTHQRLFAELRTPLADGSSPLCCASCWGHPAGSQRPSAVPQDISEHTLARAKFKNENASSGSLLVFANVRSEALV